MALLSHPLFIAVFMGIVAIGVAVMQHRLSHGTKSRQQLEQQIVSANETVYKNQVSVCERRFDAGNARFEKGERNLERIKMGLVAIYEKQGGNGAVMAEMLKEG
jgi:uncharacterized protein HemX